RNGQSIRLEMRHSLALQIRIGGVRCRRVIEHARDSVEIEHHQRLRLEKVNVEIVALVLLPEPPNEIHCERVGMDSIPKGNPELVLGENTSKIVRDNVTKVESNAVSNGDCGDRW